MKTLRANFFTGLLVLTPLVVTAWVLKGLLLWMWGVYVALPEGLQFLPTPDGPIRLLVNALGVLIVTATLGVLITVLGWVSRQYLGIQLLAAVGHVIQKIPLIGTVYSALDQLLQTFSGSKDKKFSRVVYVEFPRKGVWTLGFVTGDASSPELGKGMLSVFVPAVPNPTSGFVLLVPESDVKPTDLTVDEAFKWMLSLGLAHG